LFFLCLKHETRIRTFERRVGREESRWAAALVRSRTSLDREHTESTRLPVSVSSPKRHIKLRTPYYTTSTSTVISHQQSFNPDHDKRKRLLPRQGVYPPRICIEDRLSDRAERSFTDTPIPHTSHTSHTQPDSCFSALSLGPWKFHRFTPKAATSHPRIGQGTFI
jgi:hypothetical protein